MGGVSEQRGRPAAERACAAISRDGSSISISRDSGFKPLWRSDGKELYYLTEQSLMSVPIDTSSGFQYGAPQPLFAASLLGRGANAGRQYGVARDGAKFLFNLPQQQSTPQALTVTTNWLAATKK